MSHVYENDKWRDLSVVREPHIYTPAHDGRPFEGYLDQPDTAERARLAVYSIPFALPEKPVRPVEMHWNDIAPLYLQSYRLPGVGQAARWKPIPLPETRDE